jgi:ferredoxin
MCTKVCPHGVFNVEEGKVILENPENCMECGACQRNCPVGALSVDYGVGCAAAMIYSAITGKEESCGCDMKSTKC